MPLTSSACLFLHLSLYLTCIHNGCIKDKVHHNRVELIFVDARHCSKNKFFLEQTRGVEIAPYDPSKMLNALLWNRMESAHLGQISGVCDVQDVSSMDIFSQSVQNIQNILTNIIRRSNMFQENFSHLGTEEG